MDHVLHLLVDPRHPLFLNTDDQQNRDNAKQCNNDLIIVFPRECDHETNLQPKTGLLQIIGLTKS